MRNDDDGVFELHQIIFQPAHRLDIQIVCRLVQQKKVGISEQRLRQKYFYFLFRVQFSHQNIVIFVRNIQLVEKHFRLALGLPAVQFGKFAFQFGSAQAVFFRKIRFRIERVLFVHDLDQPLVSEHDGTDHGLRVERVLVLHQNGHPFVFIQTDLALIGFDLARKHLQKRGFSRAVGADDAVTIPFGELYIDVFE